MYKFTLKVDGAKVSVLAVDLNEAKKKIKGMGFTQEPVVELIEETSPEPVEMPSGSVEDKVDDQSAEDAEWKRRFG